MCQWARVEAHLNSIGEELLALYGPTPLKKARFFHFDWTHRWGGSEMARRQLMEVGG